MNPEFKTYHEEDYEAESDKSECEDEYDDVIVDEYHIPEYTCGPISYFDVRKDKPPTPPERDSNFLDAGRFCDGYMSTDEELTVEKLANGGCEKTERKKVKRKQKRVKSSCSSMSNTLLKPASRPRSRSKSSNRSSTNDVSGCGNGKCYSTNDLSNFVTDGIFMDKKVKDDFKNVCSRLGSINLSGLLTKQTTNITDHDRKIINCMVMKRLKEIEMKEDAIFMKNFWEQEKLKRENLSKNHYQSYKNVIKQKRKIEKKELRNRRQRLKSIEDDHIETLKNSIETKDMRANSLLRDLEIQKGIRECEKKYKELQKIDTTITNHEEREIEDDMWRYTICGHLDERITKAETVRRKNIDSYRRNLMIENEIERNLHAQKLLQAKQLENFKMKKLQEQIVSREQKYRQFLENKQKQFEQLRGRAQATALLREVVRRSMSPEHTVKMMRERRIVHL